VDKPSNTPEVYVPRSLAERTEAMFRSVDPTGAIALEWAQVLKQSESGALEALRELVRLKKLKDALDAIEPASAIGERIYKARCDEYARCKPLAWSRAFSIVGEATMVCSKCGVDRLKAPCPNGYMAETMGQCPMVGTAEGPK